MHEPQPGQPTASYAKCWRAMASAAMGVSALLLSAMVHADHADSQVTFADRSLEELMAMTVTSVAGVERLLHQTPAALSALTRDDIYAAGHLSVPEALRMVPGVHVARTDSNTWSIGTRGFNAGFGNKQLVLIDGRTTYDLLFSGTFWDVQDVLLEDLDRIEVIRGPGATLWGANAVNGVINITTRSARDTQGIFASGGGGNQEKLFSQLRYGGELGEHTWYRVWGKHHERAGFDTADGEPGGDDWRMSRVGFRIDSQPSDDLLVTVQGDAYDGTIGELISGVYNDGWARGQNLLARISRGDNLDNGWRLQTYYDRTQRNISGGFEVDRDTYDFDFRRYFTHSRHAAIWGAGLRNTRDTTRPSTLFQTGSLRYSPESRSDQTVTAFVQDTVTLVPDHWYLMVGSKFGHNDFSGFEVQPSARIWWTPDDRRMLWAAISRPVRTPSRTDEDIAIVIPGVFSFTGNPDVEAENMTAYELGYRHEVSRHLSFDIAAFHQDYRDLLSTTGTPVALTFANAASAASSGFELAGRFNSGRRLQLSGSYSYLRISERGTPADTPKGSAPRHMLKLLADAQLTEAMRLNTALYWTDDIEMTATSGYARLDVGLQWALHSGVTFRLRGQNILDEGIADTASETNLEAPRAVYLELSFRR